MKLKTGQDEFCLNCMEWMEYNNEGRCKKCKQIIHKEKRESEQEGYNRTKSEYQSFEDSSDDYD